MRIPRLGGTTYLEGRSTGTPKLNRLRGKETPGFFKIRIKRGDKSLQWVVDSLVFKQVDIEVFPGVQPELGHDLAPSGVPLMDEVGDIAWRYGDAGVWLRVTERWSEYLPNIFRWESERRRWRLCGRVETHE